MMLRNREYWIFLQVSTDQSEVDLNIPYTVGPFAFVVIQLLGIIIVMSLGAWPVFLVFFPVIGICIWLQVTMPRPYITLYF